MNTNTVFLRMILNASQVQVLGFNLTCLMDQSSLTEAAAFHRQAVWRAAANWAVEPHDGVQQAREAPAHKTNKTSG